MKLPRDTGTSPFPAAGTWRPGTANGERTAFITCPTCPTFASLHDTHEIAADGTVTPSVVCPNCTFHEHIQLEGWSDSSTTER